MTGNSPKSPHSRSLSSTRKPRAPLKWSLSVKHKVSKATKISDTTIASNITNAANSPQSTPNKLNTTNSQKSSPKNSGNIKSNPPKHAKAKDSEIQSGKVLTIPLNLLKSNHLEISRIIRLRK